MHTLNLDCSGALSSFGSGISALCLCECLTGAGRLAVRVRAAACCGEGDLWSNAFSL